MTDRRRLLALSERDMTERERLQILLENAFPDEDCKGISDRLLSCFPSVDDILGAGAEELAFVQGVPEEVARYLVCVDMCRRQLRGRIAGQYIKTKDEFSDYARKKLRCAEYEQGEFVLVGRTGKVLDAYPFTSASIQYIKLDAQRILQILSRYNCSGVYLMHNHINGEATPSREDDEFTAAAEEIGRKCGVKLLDHVIVNNRGELYSYARAGRLSGNVRPTDKKKG